ncbi:uncharacterized protein isoform X2 [Takifugu rubripes]|uniref:uncharacterized protein isoform X2 n=1 Tax=Takifugu rubripes TaxID=31033 RepID=UPI001145F420|nr:uncharacterized protein LOC115248922 isoform X2 [Takifugu rubripes]
MALHIMILLFSVTVAPSCALQMTFSQKGGLFFYTISDGPAGADCGYSYYNATDHVIANNYDKEPSLVLNSSLDGLVALKCIEHLFFKATCDKGEFYSANVTVACEDLRSNEDAAKGINPVTKGNMHNNSSMPPSVTNGSSDQTVLAVVLVVLVVPVVLVVVLVMWCKYKKKYEVCCGKIFERFCRPGQEPGPGQEPDPAGTHILQLSKPPQRCWSGYMPNGDSAVFCCLQLSPTITASALMLLNLFKHFFNLGTFIIAFKLS